MEKSEAEALAAEIQARHNKALAAMRNMAKSLNAMADEIEAGRAAFSHTNDFYVTLLLGGTILSLHCGNSAQHATTNEKYSIEHVVREWGSLLS